ncbi:MAG: hypothetical protein AABX04_05785 [Nanoarchaeota archaeon]
MHKKAVITSVLVFLLFVSIVAAADTTTDITTSSSSCTGFWGKIGCFIFGDASKRIAIGGWKNE